MYTRSCLSDSNRAGRAPEKRTLRTYLRAYLTTCSPSWAVGHPKLLNKAPTWCTPKILVLVQPKCASAKFPALSASLIGTEVRFASVKLFQWANTEFLGILVVEIATIA